MLKGAPKRGHWNRAFVGASENFKEAERGIGLASDIFLRRVMITGDREACSPIRLEGEASPKFSNWIETATQCVHARKARVPVSLR